MPHLLPGRRASRCSTQIDHLPWLVIMRDKVQAKLRIGRGSYRWSFVPEEGWRISEMHIRIDRMDSLPDRAGGLVTTLQSFLPYPWLRPAALDEALAPLARCNPAFGFVTEFLSEKFERPEQGVFAPA
jgi:hypothetical protein